MLTLRLALTIPPLPLLPQPQQPLNQGYEILTSRGSEPGSEVGNQPEQVKNASPT